MRLDEPYLLSAAGPHPHKYVLPAITVAKLTSTIVGLHCVGLPPADSRTLAAIQPETLALDNGTFTSLSHAASELRFPTVVVQQNGPDLVASCACAIPKTSLCEHQALVLLSILQRKELRLFFDKPARHAYMRTLARDYGLEQAEDLDEHFELTYTRPSLVSAVPRRPDLYAVTATTKQELITQLLPTKRRPAADLPPANSCWC
ncbi:hypothetical protein H9L05_14250 [Hymenobacter qilianensis]|uniref:SWIM-type domain-containing protein n=1 Tax=Hymenobacter qilianensis TaxID=1385715 RepID=A0A7H0GSG7_9BACT|nr:hypothetical protein [Hymenobacter qilianensis]QNP51233.1 hypothetical protein H9L05_14250 [Hymenobacter qilianensis]